MLFRSRQIATGILEFEGAEVIQYPCAYEDYLHEKEKRMARLNGNSGTAGAGGGGSAGNGNRSTGTENSFGNARAGQGNGAGGGTPTIADVFDKKTYYSPGKIKSRLTRQLEKYERLLEESEQRMAELKLQMMDPALASDYEKLMELQTQLDEEEHNQESLLERMMETETLLQEVGTGERTDGK